MKSKGNIIGAWAFLVGVVLAVILGIFNVSPTYSNIVLSVLVIAGILIGVLNVTNKESSRFLLAGVALVFVSALGQNAIYAFDVVAIGPVQIGAMLNGILNALLILFVPATIIVALKSIFDLAKN